MPIPSLYISGKNTEPWSVARAAVYGAGIGALAAVFKTFGPVREADSVVASFTDKLGANWSEIAAATLAFALLCAGAALLRNFIARRLIWRELPIARRPLRSRQVADGKHDVREYGHPSSIRGDVRNWRKNTDRCDGGN